MPPVPTQALLAVNGGSSSLRFAVYRREPRLPLLFRGQVAPLGEAARCRVADHRGEVLRDERLAAADHRQALGVVLDWLGREATALEMVAAGHRVVHGGPRFHAPVRLSPGVVAELASLLPLAPNHQGASLQGIAALGRLRPAMPQFACFDTGFHHQRPEVEQRFALPARPELASVRRYGFHGLSYEYIASVLEGYLGARAGGRVIVAHLGHGASLCALRDRRSVATTMTFTPLDGIPMGTRCGALDPAVVLYLLQQQGMSPAAVSDLLYFQSGLLGVSGASDDMAELLALETPQAARAIEQFVHYTVRAIGSLAAALEGLDALVFTGGIGEHAPAIRAAICGRCAWLGLALDADANSRGRACITRPDSAVQAWTIATDEEQMIARHTLRLLESDADDAEGA